MSGIPDHNWEHSVYGKHEEDIAKDAPEPLRKKIVLTNYFDASFMHDMLSEKAGTSVCTFYNKTPVDCYWDIYVDDYCGVIQGNKCQRQMVKRILFQALDKVFRPLDNDDTTFCQEPASIKKLKKSDAC